MSQDAPERVGQTGIRDTFEALSSRTDRADRTDRCGLLRANNVQAEEDLARQVADLGALAGLATAAPRREDAESASDRASEHARDRVLDRLVRRMGTVWSLPVDEAALHALEQDTRPLSAALPDFAKACGWRLRAVNLDADLYRRSSQPLLAFVRDPDAEDGPEPAAEAGQGLQTGFGRGRAVLLFPAANGGKLYDPVTDTQRRLLPADMDHLQTRAWVLYERFPEGKLTPRTLLGFVLRHSRPIFALVALTGLLSALMSLATPLVTEYITGRIIPLANYSELSQLAALLVVFTACTAGFQLVPTLSMLVFGAQRYERFQAALFDHCLRVPVNTYQLCPAGDMTQRILGAAQIEETIFSLVTGQFVGTLFQIFSLAMMFYYSVPLACAGVALVAVYALVVFLLARVNLRPLAESTASEGRLSGLLRQFLEGMGKIRSAVAETRVINHCLAEFAVQTRAHYLISRNNAVQSLFSTAFPMLISLLFYALVGGVWQGEMGLPAFMAFMAAFQNFQAGMVGIVSSLWTLMAIRPDYERLLPLLEAQPEDSRRGEDPGVLDGRLELAHVSFRYGDSATKTLDDVCLHVNPGEFVAITGPSGAGKSTLVRLVLGFEQPESGAILYSGRDLAGLDVRRLRQQLGVILQSSRVLTASILENIVIGTQYTLQDAWTALEHAAMADTVQAMPMGIHTIVSPETISGGQQQRILLARALVGNPAILLLDESTSALDNAAQEAVKAHLEQLRATRIVIAHRLSTIVNADRIYVLDQGRVVQHGTYAELVAREGLFRDLVRRQRTDMAG